MTADPSRAVGGPPAWFVTTAQDVVLAGPFARRETADVAYDDTVEYLRRDLERQRQGEDYVALQLAAVVVRFGTLNGWGGFVPAD